MTSEIPPQTFTAGFGGFVSADAELSITIEEFRRVRVPRAPASLVRVRSFNSNRMPFIHIWSAAFGLQIHDRGPTPFAPVMLIPITTGRFYRCWFNAIQSAMCQAVTGPAGANCNFHFGFITAFFAFT
jgi:hypothetical protein